MARVCDEMGWPRTRKLPIEGNSLASLYAGRSRCAGVPSRAALSSMAHRGPLTRRTLRWSIPLTRGCARASALRSKQRRRTL